MKNWLSNPYPNRATIREPDMFFGRTDLLRRVYEAVFHRNCVELVGPRGIGKSSFLYCASLPQIQARFSFDLSRHIFVFLDLRKYLSRTSEDFFHSVSRSIINQSAKMHLELQVGDSSGEDEFSSLLDQIEEQGYYLTLLLDAFDKITRNKYFDLEFFEFLRAHASVGLVSYVTASIAPLYEVCHRGIAGSPFFNIFDTYHLQAFSHEEAIEAITVPARRAGLPLTETETSHVLTLAGRHPFFIQRVCHILYDEKLQHGGINGPPLRDRAYKELFPHFDDIWQQFSEKQQMLLLEEAQVKDRQQRACPAFSESLLFRQFVRNTCETGFFDMTIEDLEDALSKIKDPEGLGNANLRLMRVVNQKLKQLTSPSTAEKGMIVREVLHDAFERLRAGNTRSDSAPEWRLYNILYYRYFRYQMKHEHIVARLGITSKRQYFRERTRAIESLRNILLEMERTAKKAE